MVFGSVFGEVLSSVSSMPIVTNTNKLFAASGVARSGTFVSCVSLYERTARHDGALLT